MKLLAALIIIYNLILLMSDILTNPNNDILTIIDRVAMLSTIFICWGVIA